MRILSKINKFYVAMALIMMVLAVLVAVSFRSIFANIGLAGEIDESLLTTDVPRLEVQKVDKALNTERDKSIPPLDL